MRKKIGRQRAQGMTEYVILVGLVAILLVTAVNQFKDEIETVIVGSSGKVEETGNRIDNAPMGGEEEPPAAEPEGRLTDDGYRVFEDNTVDEGGTRVAYDPELHGEIVQ